MAAPARSGKADVDVYLAALAPDKRAPLERLRKIIRGAVPRAEECISYKIPAFRLDGRMLVWYGAGAHHCSFFPGGLVQSFKGDLRGFETSKGTIRFDGDHPLPATLVRRIVKAAATRNAAKERARRR